MVMTTYVAIVKAKTKWAKATVSPATRASLVLVLLESHQNLRPYGGADHRPTQVLFLTEDGTAELSLAGVLPL